MATVTDVQRKYFAKQGWAMPDGSYYVRPDHPEDLPNSILGVGRATATGTPSASDEEQRNAVRRHIMSRAKALGRSKEIPSTWNPDGTLKHSSTSTVEEFLTAYGIAAPKFQQLGEGISEFLAHYGVRGMRWGVRSRSGSHTSNHPVSPDAARATATKLQIKRSGTQSVTNADLQHLVTRMNLETQYGKLNSAHVNSGQRYVAKLGQDVLKQEAASLVSKYAAKGAEHLIKKYTKK